MNKKITWGVILLRAQPFHYGHVELIKKACRENDKVLVLVGSADKSGNIRNPIPVDFRIELIKKSLDDIDKDLFNKVIIVPLKDYTDESDNSHDWGFYLYSNIVKHIECAEFFMYYSDGWRIIMDWFPDFLLKDFVSFQLLARGTIYDNLSATHVRETIVKADYEELEKIVPRPVFEEREKIRDYILKSIINSTKK